MYFEALKIIFEENVHTIGCSHWYLIYEPIFYFLQFFIDSRTDKQTDILKKKQSNFATNKYKINQIFFKYEYLIKSNILNKCI